jgi:putative lipoic acid-binding regulatory protein
LLGPSFFEIKVVDLAHLPFIETTVEILDKQLPAHQIKITQQA